MKTQSKLTVISGWIFGLFVLTNGILNMARGNDFNLGVALTILSFIYYPPVNRLIKQISGYSLHYMIKIILAFLIVWITIAVGAIAEGYYPEII